MKVTIEKILPPFVGKIKDFASLSSGRKELKEEPVYD